MEFHLYDRQRYLIFAACIAFTALCLAMLPVSAWFLLGVVVFGALSAVGIYDMMQTHHSILRNYPVLGHMRFIFEGIRPEIRQYLIESDQDEEPFSREERSLVYQRAKNVESARPFGTKLHVYNTGYSWLTHSVNPRNIENTDFRTTVGNSQCSQPYEISLYNISAMSFGSLSANAILALSMGAKEGGFAHDTGEGGISRYHRQGGGDLIYEVGTGYFGCRDEKGNFDPGKFAEQAASEQVRMIEVKLSQGAKPGHGGLLPASKVSPEIAEARGIPLGVDCHSPAGHSAFTTPIEFMQFLQQLRELSKGKPVGFKLCVGHRREFMCMVKAMLETGITPDFIVVDGKEGGTGAAPLEFSNHLGMPLQDGLVFVHNTLRGAGLRDDVKIGASGKLISSFDIAKAIGMGADWANSARGFMFSVGCIQAQACHTNRCPTGVATQDKTRQRALVVEDKYLRVASFQRETMKALGSMTGASGLDHPSQFMPHHFQKRGHDGQMIGGQRVFPYLPEGFLLREGDDYEPYRYRWNRASADRFTSPDLPGV